MVKPLARRAGDRRSGMTLIEVLVAVVLLALLSSGLLMAFQIGVGSWRDAKQRLTLDRRIATSNDLLHAQFAGIVPVIPQVLARSALRQRGPFFQGEPGRMRFVSSYSMTEGVRGGLQIVELMVSTGPSGLRLLLTQSRYQGPLSVGRFIIGSEPSEKGQRLLFAPLQPRADSLIVADRLAACDFLFLRSDRRERQDEWVPVWDDLRQLPQAIKVEMRPLEREARLQPVTIVAEVRARYGDDVLQSWRDFLKPGAEIVELNGRTHLQMGTGK